MNKLPRIKAEFILSSEIANINDITCRMNIKSASSKDQFPPTSIANPYWCIETADLTCLSFEEPIYLLMNQLIDKVTVIKAICDEYKIVPVLQIITYFNYINRPEMSIPHDIISFLAKINAEICIEPCIAS